MDPVSEPPSSIAFGRFRVVPHRRELLANGRSVKLGGRAFDALLALIEAGGAVVRKDALIARIWPNRVVEEHNLEVQISVLRAALGAERELIRTISGRGYQFTGEFRILPAGRDERAGPGMADPRDTRPGGGLPGDRSSTNLPHPVSELIGRDDELEEVLRLTVAHRLLTLTGAGGIGKTRLAIAVARRLLPRFTDGVWLAEFSPLADPGLVPAAVAAAVGLDLGAGEVSAQRVAQALAERRLVLVLDTCEHVVAAAADMAEALLRANPTAHVMATSREPLRAEGEWVYPVPPLTVPEHDAEDADDPLRYGAVRLFVDRARAAAHFAPDRRAAAMIGAICRRLDGIPLAIELAAASAGAVVADDQMAASEVAAIVASLVAKSLVAADVESAFTRYRLLDMTRAYALEKLDQSSERERFARSHAEYYRDLFERAESEWKRRPPAEWLADYRRHIDNLRTALDWAFAPGGDAAIGVALTAAAVLLWMRLSLMEECRGGVERALATLDTGAGRDACHEMKLRAALGASLIYARGAVPEIGAAWTRTLELAERLDDAEYQLRSLSGLWFFQSASGRHRAALALAQRLHMLAKRPDTNDWLVGERLIGISQHYLGDQPSARRRLQHVLAHYVPLTQKPHIIPFPLDQRMMARVFLARTLWLQGFPDQATAQPKTALRMRARPIMQTRCVTLCPRRRVRSRCWSAISSRRNITWRCCATIRQDVGWRSGTPGAVAIRGRSSLSAAISARDCGCCATVTTSLVRLGLPACGLLGSRWRKLWAVPGRSATGST
jgi:predicted ATPase/DNA-binding winged helix-turn-helix (wHTH) protein